MDVLADEDHIHILITQEHYHYKSNWWFRSVPVERRLDLKKSIVYFAAIETERRRSKKSTMGTKFFFFMVDLTRFVTDLLLIYCKVIQAAIEKCLSSCVLEI